MGRNERSIQLTRYTGDLLGAMVVRDPQAAMEAMEAITAEYGDKGVFTACYTASEIVRRIAFPNMPRGNGTLNGPIVGIDAKANNLPGHHLWAVRFFAAYVNGDTATTNALFTCHRDDPDSFAAGVGSLLAMCAETLRDSMDDQ